MPWQEFSRLFPNPETVLLYLEQKLWHGKAVCPHCKSAKVYKLRRNGFWHCNGCNKQFNVLTDSIFKRTRIPLDRWFYAMHQVSHKRISINQLSKDMGISFKSALRMRRKIQGAMCKDKYKRLLKGILEIDEVWLGGKKKNMHYAVRKLLKGRGSAHKIPVIGFIERGSGRMLSFAVKRANARTALRLIQNFVKKGSVINTDESKIYSRLPGSGYKRWAVNHKKGIYGIGSKTTNRIESGWALLKRTYHGTHYWISREHLQGYLDEFDFRWNNRDVPMVTAIDNILAGCFK